MARRQSAGTKRATEVEGDEDEASALETQRAELEAERREFDKSAEKVKKQLEDAEKELEAERARLSDLEDELDAEKKADPVDPDAERIAKLKAAIARCNGIGGIRLTVFRKIDGEDVLLAFPRIQLGDTEVEEYQERVAVAHGGGRFRVQFRDSSGQFVGAPAEFTVDGPPKRIGGGALVAGDGPTTPAGPSPREAELLATIARLEANEKKAAEERTLAAHLAPLLEKIEALEKKGAVVPPPKPEPTPIEKLFFEREKREDQARLSAPPVSPEITELKAALASQTKLIEDLRKTGEKREQEAAKAELRAEIKALGDRITTLTTAQTKPRHPMFDIIAEAKEMDLLVNAGKKDGDRVPIFERFMDKMGDRLAVPFLGILEEKATQVANAMAGKAPATGATPGTPKGSDKPEDKQAYADWLTAEFKTNFMVVKDKAAIAKVLRSFPTLLAGLMAVKDRKQMIEHLADAVGFPREKVELVCDDNAWTRLEPRIAELRETVRAIVAEVEAKEAAKAESEKKKAEKAAAEDEDEDQDDEDEDDGESDDADDEEEDDEGAPGAEGVQGSGAGQAAPPAGGVRAPREGEPG